MERRGPRKAEGWLRCLTWDFWSFFFFFFFFNEVSYIIGCLDLELFFGNNHQ